jgi:hypothetical protein
MPAQQPGLFDEPGAGTAVTPSVRPHSRGQALTKKQRQFNRLTARLQQLRVELASWQRALDRYRQRSAAELGSLQRELLTEQRAAVRLMDELLVSAKKGDGLTRARRRKLSELVVMLAAIVLEAGPDAEVEVIFDRHTHVRHRDVRRNEFEFTEAMLEAVLGDAFMAGHTAKDSDELFEQAAERLQAELEAEAEERREQVHARRARSKRPETQREREASQSVRDVFRRLAAAIHPDRERDGAERQRKTVLMQRVNQAYERNDLLELLTVQFEIEQIDSDHLAQASEARLGHYCAVLQEQQRALESELAALQSPLRAALDIAPYGGGLHPELLDLLVDRDARNGRAVLDQLRGDMEALRDPARRGATIDAIEIDHGEADPFDDAMLSEIFGSPPAPSRKPKRRRR